MGRVGRALIWHELLERTRDRWVIVISILFALLASGVGLYGRSAETEVSKLTGPGFVPLRLVSLVSSLGTAWIVHLFVRRETGRVVLGAIAAGIFLATWRTSGLYFDVARLDSLFTFLLLASLYQLRFPLCRQHDLCRTTRAGRQHPQAHKGCGH